MNAPVVIRNIDRPSGDVAGQDQRHAATVTTWQPRAPIDGARPHGGCPAAANGPLADVRLPRLVLPLGARSQHAHGDESDNDADANQDECYGHWAMPRLELQPDGQRFSLILAFLPRSSRR